MKVVRAIAPRYVRSLPVCVLDTPIITTGRKNELDCLRGLYEPVYEVRRAQKHAQQERAEHEVP